MPTLYAKRVEVIAYGYGRSEETHLYYDEACTKLAGMYGWWAPLRPDANGYIMHNCAKYLVRFVN